MATQAFYISDLPAVATPKTELPGGLMEVETKTGPGGSLQNKKLTVEQLAAFLATLGLNANDLPSLYKSVEFRTRAEQQQLYPALYNAQVMAELKGDTMALGTQIWANTDPDGVNVYRVVYDSAGPLRVWTDGTFGASGRGLQPAKFVAVTAAVALPTPAAPTLTFTAARKLVAVLAGYADSDFEYKQGTGSYVAYPAGGVQVDDNQHAAGELQFRVKATASHPAGAPASNELLAARTRRMNWVPVGDSITFGIGTDPNQDTDSYPAQEQATLPATNYKLTNKGVSGKQVSAMRDDASTFLYPLYDASYDVNFAAVLGGTNDLLYNTYASADEILLSLQQLHQGLHTAGFVTAAGTILPIRDLPAAQEAKRQAVNAGIKAKAVSDWGCAGVDDYDGLGFNTLSDSADGIHPNKAFYGRMAALERVTLGQVAVAHQVPFTPAGGGGSGILPYTRFWFRAEDAVIDGNGVFSILDHAGSGAKLVAATGTPQLIPNGNNGKQTVRLNGASLVSTLNGSVMGNNPCALLVACKSNNADQNYNIAGLVTNDNNPGHCLDLLLFNGKLTTHNGQAFDGNTPVVDLSSGFHVLGSLYDGTNVRTFNNGTFTAPYPLTNTLSDTPVALGIGGYSFDPGLQDADLTFTDYVVRFNGDEAPFLQQADMLKAAAAIPY